MLANLKNVLLGVNINFSIETCHARYLAIELFFFHLEVVESDSIFFLCSETYEKHSCLIKIMLSKLRLSDAYNIKTYVRCQLSKAGEARYIGTIVQCTD